MVAAHDQVVLRFEEACGALLRFPYFPIAIGGLIETPFEIAQFGFIWRMREMRIPIAPHAAPNSDATPMANIYGS